MASANLRRSDTTKGPPLRLLCLDGGGVRGYSMLILLQELMHRTFVEIHGKAPRRHEIPKPCEHFDLIAGTGTGGLIAIMLGRLRLDLETCKDVYVRMTKKVFETDKTFAGIPYGKTLFKASKLEEAIMECVKEHTIFEDEGNDISSAGTSMAPTSPGVASHDTLHRAVSSSSSSRGSGYAPAAHRGSAGGSRAWGNSNALLYDVRENRTKTAVCAVYKGTPPNGSSALLRSYDSRKEPSPEFNCTIWQAGRATAATGLAFKPIQIGQSLFIDEGAGKYNPSPQILEEAVVNEWPGRDIGVFVSIGTGKRPASSKQGNHDEWWEGFMGDYAEARKRLIFKIEGCEETHLLMIREHLLRYGVNAENYYRLNVEVGVGEFGMNEWNRLSDISTNTRMYLGRDEVQNTIISAASKMSRIHKAKLRFETTGETGSRKERYSWDSSIRNETLPPSNPMAVELPAGDFYELDSQPAPYHGHQFQKHAFPNDKFSVVDDMQNLSLQHQQQPQPSLQYQRPRESTNDYRSNDSHDRPPPLHVYHRNAPPVPPKTPITSPDMQQRLPSISTSPFSPSQRTMPARPLPYPDTDLPPPTVNMAKKPQYGRPPAGLY